MSTNLKLNEVEICLNELEIMKLEMTEETTNVYTSAQASQEKYKLDKELESIAKKNLKVIYER